MYKIIATLLVTVPVVAAAGTILCSNEVVDFDIMDLSVSPPIFTDLTPKVDLSDFSTCSLNIAANVKSTPSNCDEKIVQCVKFFFDGVEVNKEKLAPWTYFADRNGAFTAGKPPAGSHTLKACTYSDKACTQDESGCREMEVEFKDCDGSGCDNINEVTGFELVNTESPYRPVVTSFTPPMIDLLDYPTCMLNIYATATSNTCGDAPIKCVKLMLGSQVRREVDIPYALYGNTGRFIRSGKPALGAQTLKACTYTDEGCTEGESGCLDVDVFIKDCIENSMSMITPITTIQPTSNPAISPISIQNQLTIACAFINMANISKCQKETRVFSSILGTTIPTELGLLTQINYLWLSRNQLIGTIPSTVGLLTKLTDLELYENQLTGTIPSTLGQLMQLTRLDLDNNQLNGTIPSTLGQLTQLTYLSLSNNQLTGTIPSTLGQLTQLTYLSLSNNQLTGTIPSTLFQLTQLTSLDLDDNQLTGTIPSTLGQLTQLTRLDLNNNQLTGTIPSTLGQLTTQLAYLRLYNNTLTGTIPSTFCSGAGIYLYFFYIDCDEIVCSCCRDGNTSPFSFCPPATAIQPTSNPATSPILIQNQLTIACAFIKTTKISDCQAKKIFYSSNNIGTIPTELGLLTQLTYLDLYSNQLIGTIPSTLGQLTQLISLSLHGNQLTSTIPYTLGQLTQLTYLRLDRNQLTGTIPSTLGQLTKLNYLELYENQLTGTIPSTLGQLTQQLTDLGLSDNQLTGTIPSTLGQLTQQLTGLSLSNNQLTGTIPSTLCSVSLIVILIDCDEIVCSCCLDGNTSPLSSCPL